MERKTTKEESDSKVAPPRERVFSVELKTRNALKSASLGTNRADGILIEGTLGELKSATFLDGIVLKVLGTNGTLRVDLMKVELLFAKPTPRGRWRR